MLIVRNDNHKNDDNNNTLITFCGVLHNKKSKLSFLGPMDPFDLESAEDRGAGSGGFSK